MNTGCLAIVIVMVLLVMGGHGVYVAITNRAPTVMSCKEYLEKKPSASWLTLTDVSFDLAEAVVKTDRSGSITTAYIPVHPRDAVTDRVSILLATEDGKFILPITRLQSLKPGSSESALKALETSVQKVKDTTEITGLIQSSVTGDSKTTRKIENISGHLAKDYIIIDEGKKPELAVHAGMLALGILGAWLLLRRASKTPEAPPPPPNLPMRQFSGPPPLPPR